MSIQTLIELKEKIEKTKTTFTKNQGKLELLQKELKDTFGFATVDKARTALKEEKKELKKYTENLNKIIDEINDELEEMEEV